MADFSQRLKTFARRLRSGLDRALSGAGTGGGDGEGGDRSGGPRAAGPPRSPNGASSFHLGWRMPPGVSRGGIRLVEVSAVLEILAPPTVPSLYFWALQVDFFSGGRVVGGAHTGLQWNRRYPGGTAVNWGGYAPQDRGGRVLAGSRSALPGFADDPNTLAYSWLPGRAYRLRVFRSPERAGSWRATVTDLVAGETVVIRDLYVEAQGRGAAGSDFGAHFLARPVVWSEVFAACDAPSVAVRWSDLSAVEQSGVEVRPAGVAISYQSAAAGGCSNTDVRTDGQGYLQITNTPRVTRQDTVLPPLPSRAFAQR